jgi:histidinol phosphatase-like PHP family hydrolase
MDPLDLVREASRLKLDGICLTEHQVLWQPEEVEELARGAQIAIFRGNEFTTNMGDVLVFGYEQDDKELLTIQELRDRVAAAGGFMIAAHPFRGFKTFGIGHLEMNLDQACEWKVFDFVDAIEIRNGNDSAEESDMAAQVAARLGLPGTAGSDAHEADEVGKWTTDFEREIENEQQLVEELKAGRFSASAGSGRD